MPEVSIIMPVRNERHYIVAVIDSVLKNDYPAEDVEILIVDGMSDDGTREIIKGYADRYPRIRMLDNPRGDAAAAMNIGLRGSSGNVVMRLDAHALYPDDYVTQCVHALHALHADNVGACVDTLPADLSAKAAAISIVMSHPFGVGNSAFRTCGEGDAPVLVDTVPFGCYRRDVFDKVGFFDEDLIRNQDNEFNERLTKAGGKIFLLPKLRVGYYARREFSQLWRMFYQYGYFGPLVDIKLGSRTRLRRYIPLVFVLSLILPLVGGFFLRESFLVALASLFFYLVVAVFFSASIASRRGGLAIGFLSLWGFVTAHFSYGFGHLLGILDFNFLKKHLDGAVRVRLTR